MGKEVADMASPQPIQDMQHTKALGRHIQGRALEHGWDTQAQMGSALGLSQGTVGNYLADPDKIRIGSLRKMIRKFRLSPEVVLLALGYTQSEINRIGK